MRRARVRGALIALVLLVLGGIGYLIGQTVLEQRRSAEKTAEALMDSDVAQSIRHFHRVKVEDGRTVWDLRADKADFLDEGRVMVEVPELAFFTDDGRSVKLHGTRGEVVLDGPEVGRIDLDGGIEVSAGRYRLETPSASWIDKMNKVVADSGVEIRGGDVALTGQTMIVDIERRRVVVIGDVRTVIERSGGESREAEPQGVSGADSAGEPVPAQEEARAS